ncbi:MAG: Gfo/Idh/MocA family oxidoreductase [Candidatus Competibacteraceae bacterium]|nr:Gfo/Idh/MocA family oxidoreductase [Candidatus Competibacteraceae bacterium]
MTALNSQEKVRTAVVGVGYLGTFHAEKYAALPDAELCAVVDTNPDQAAAVAQRLDVAALTDYRALLGQVDAVSVVVPTQNHFEVAKFFLEHKVHVLVDKPMTTTVVQAKQLINAAKQNGCLLQVGHLERFNPAFTATRPLLYQPRFIESHRLAPFKPRGTDVNVVLDLMIHDIDLVLSIVSAPLSQISAIGVPVLTAGADIANARLEFTNGCVANLTASRVSNKSERKLRIFQPNAYFSLDLQDKSMTVHRKQGNDDELQITVETQHYPQADALYLQLQAFLQAVQQDSAPEVTGEDGKQALAAAMQITTEIKQQANSVAITGAQ